MSMIHKRHSICWSLQLPTYSGTKSYQNLLVEVYGGTVGYGWPSTKLDSIIQNAPINLIRSGIHSVGSPSSQGNIGLYWISVSFGTTHAGDLYFLPTLLHPQDSSVKSYGMPIRCLVPLGISKTFLTELSFI